MATDNGQFVYAFGGARSCIDDDSSAACNRKVLSSIVGYFDNSYPDVWAALAPAVQ